MFSLANKKRKLDASLDSLFYLWDQVNLMMRVTGSPASDRICHDDEATCLLSSFRRSQSLESQRQE